MTPPVKWPLNEEFVVDTKEKAKLALKNVSKEEWKILLDVLDDKFWNKLKSVKSKEKEKKTPEFEDKNHREKSDDTWKKKTEKIGNPKEYEANRWKGAEYEVENFEVEVNPEGDIKEYVSGVPAELIWEQLFSKKALIRLWLLNRLPENYPVIEEMINAQPWKDRDEQYANFYKKNIKNNKKNSLAGCCNQEMFVGVDRWVDYWLGDGQCTRFYKEGCHWHGDNDDCFFSVRLLKN